jgi:hypothetical protein
MFAALAATAAAESKFKMRNADSGLYLSLTGAVRQNGGRTVQWRDVGQPDAVWTFEAADDGGIRIRNDVSGKYLLATDEGLVLQWDDDGQRGLIWLRQEAGAAGCYRLRNRDVGTFLSTADGSHKEGAAVIARQEASLTGAVWCRESLESADAAGAIIKLRNDYSRMFLAARNDTSEEADNVIQTGDAGSADIAWTFEPGDKGTVKIRNAVSGKYLAIAGGNLAPGANVVQSPDRGQPGLTWEREDAETGNCYKFRNHNSGLYLAVDDGSQQEGATVVQWGDVGHRLDIEWCRER